MNIFNLKNINNKDQQRGFVLPTVLVLSIVLLTLGLSVFQLTSTIARSLTDQYWQKVAKQASQAGVSYMSACVDQGLSTGTWPDSITQDTSCLGAVQTTTGYLFTNSTDTNPVPNPFRSSFIIYKPTLGADGIPKARVVGTVSILNTAGTVIKKYTYEMVSLINGPSRASTQVSAGAFHTCSLADNQVYCWGKNTSGELGVNSSTTYFTTPQYVSSNLSDKGVTSISAGGALDGTTGQPHTCMVANGQAFCTGENANGQLGIGNTTRQLSPMPLTQSVGALGDGVDTGIAAGRYNGCAIANGRASCWGYNPSGSTGSSNSPIAISTAVMTGWVTQVAAGHSYSCAIADGKVYCWGANASGQLGTGNATSQANPYDVSTPTALAGKTATSIAVGTSTTCAIANGQLFCWGLNTNGQLGINSVISQNLPQNVSTVASTPMAGENVTDVSVGGGFVCAIADGTLYCWGDNDYGQLGLGNTNQQQLPQSVNASGILNGKVVTDVDAGSDHVCALSQGDTYCWGLNNYGQLGDGTTTNRSSPIKSLNSF